ncbi:MAG TPA: NAD(P)-binding domain-containing protein [Bacteroidia bacterium]|nr:NAD(P)-binding domain-containing protein [Bacteroidia bacterium]
MKYLIIGAGPCGLIMAKYMKEAGIEYEHAEADSNLGGNWFHGVYDSVYTDADKSTMEYPAFQMPESYPDFLSAKQMLKYYNDFADSFGLRSMIQFNTSVTWITAESDNSWSVQFNNGITKIYTGVIICNGHHWDRNIPELPGNFEGTVLHSKDYKNGSQLTGKKVLVVGSRNSAVDIACEAARYGAKAVLSMRESPWIIPKAFFGKPLSKLGGGMPDLLKPYLIKLLVRLSFGAYSDYKMAKPQHRPLQKLPTMSEEFPYYLRHGRVKVKPGISDCAGNTIRFSDKSEEEFDLVVMATGYKLSFPFLPEELSRTRGQNLLCYGYSVYSDYKGLFFFGWPQVIGGIGQLSEMMAAALVDLIKLEHETDLPSGLILMTKGNELSKNNRPTGKEISKWIRKNSYSKLIRVARKDLRNKVHTNLPTREMYERKPVAYY